MSIIEAIRENKAFDGIHPNEITRAVNLVHRAMTEDDEGIMAQAKDALAVLPVNAGTEVWSMAVTMFHQPEPKRTECKYDGRSTRIRAQQYRVGAGRAPAFACV